MFRRCTQGHEEVRWSQLAPNPLHCWYCGKVGDDLMLLDATSNLEPFAPGTLSDRVWAWMRGEVA